jgi:cyclic peptide transporter
MKLLKLLPRQSGRIYAIIIFLSLLNTLMFSGILLIINRTLAGKPPISGDLTWLAYGGLIAGSFLVGKIFYRYMINMSQDALFTVEVTLLQKIRHALYQDFEKIGDENIYAAINDAKLLAQLPEILLGVFNAAVMVACGLGYMFFISPLGALLILAWMIILLILYLTRNVGIEKGLNTIRDLQTKYYRYLRDLLFGFREIRMSITRNETLYHRYLLDNRQNSKGLSIRTNIQYMDNELLGSLSWYIMLGLILFVLPKAFHLHAEQLTTFVVVTLYLMGPVSTLIKFLPFFTRTRIAVQRIDQLEKDIQAHIVLNQQLDDLTPAGKHFRSIRFSAIEFQYPGGKDRPGFKVGPLNLEIRRGETIFVTGSNGSGKSTFINMIAGLYLPTSGNICWNDIRTGAHNHSYYSDQFSAILTGNHLFRENYDQFELHSSNARLKDLIEMMHLNDVIALGNGKSFLGTNYSKGQQKRIALILAMLENKEVFLLDEWAAEQDPAFRSYFYHILLPLLKKEGKTVIAVTHDESYFHCADRILRFESGSIIENHTADIHEKSVLKYESPY